MDPDTSIAGGREKFVLDLVGYIRATGFDPVHYGTDVPQSKAPVTRGFASCRGGI